MESVGGIGIALWIALALLFVALVGLVFWGFRLAERNGIEIPRKVKIVRVANLVIVFVLLVFTYLWVQNR